MKEMLGITMFPLVSHNLFPRYCDRIRIAHTQKTVSISLCPGAAQGAWKHAPIIPLPRHNALIQACPPYFF